MAISNQVKPHLTGYEFFKRFLVLRQKSLTVKIIPGNLSGRHFIGDRHNLLSIPNIACFSSEMGHIIVFPVKQHYTGDSAISKVLLFETFRIINRPEVDSTNQSTIKWRQHV